MPKVSIITPAYNCAWSITDTITSVQSQAFTDWEMLVVNDHSTDDTSHVVASISAKDTRVRLLLNPKKGVSSARNFGIDNATGDYITFLDADDILYPDALGLRVEALDQHPDWRGVYALTQFVDNHLNKLGWTLGNAEKITFDDMYGNAVHPNAPMVRMSQIGTIRFDETVPAGEDWLMHARLLRTGMTWYRVDGAEVCYRINPQSTVMKNQKRYEEGLRPVIDLIYGEDPGCPNPAPHYRLGLVDPPKSLVLMWRNLSLLTTMIINHDPQAEIVALATDIANTRSDPIEKPRLQNLIKYAYIRSRACHSDAWQAPFRKEKGAIEPHLIPLERILPDYVRTIRELWEKRYLEDRSHALLSLLRGPRRSLILMAMLSLFIAAYGLTDAFASSLIAPFALLPLFFAYHRRVSRRYQSLQRENAQLRSLLGQDDQAFPAD